ncbi:uncharacterized protein LOC123013828 [Tribolium madens]|uniref:uncharacterized protein LOC123013828 n=1 Tax=Tribolium madens TaxID=41895 RepID=UPI001CF73A72|nr:uncharacterized protein LOC123013828 [Tribolium madens]
MGHVSDVLTVGINDAKNQPTILEESQPRYNIQEMCSPGIAKGPPNAKTLYTKIAHELNPTADLSRSRNHTTSKLSGIDQMTFKCYCISVQQLPSSLTFRQ